MYIFDLAQAELDRADRRLSEAGRTLDAQGGGLDVTALPPSDALHAGTRDLAAGEVRQMFADGKIAMKMDGPWLYPIIQKGKAKDQIKLGMVPFKPPVGGSSNVLGIAADAPKENKKLVWDFIALATSDKFQSSYATLGASPPPSPRADTSAATKDTPHFDLLVQATKAAAEGQPSRQERFRALTNQLARAWALQPAVVLLAQSQQSPRALPPPPDPASPERDWVQPVLDC